MGCIVRANQPSEESMAISRSRDVFGRIKLAKCGKRTVVTAEAGVSVPGPDANQNGLEAFRAAAGIVSITHYRVNTQRGQAPEQQLGHPVITIPISTLTDTKIYTSRNHISERLTFLAQQNYWKF